MPRDPVVTKPIPLPATFQLDGVVEYQSAAPGEPLRALTVCHRDGRLHCRTGIPEAAPPPERLWKAHVTFAFGSSDNREVPIVTTIDPDPGLEVFELTPDDAGLDGHIVQRFRDIADHLGGSPLRTFISDVFSMPNVFHCFWTCPGSQHHHHARPGGLAEHSIEMAEQVTAMEHLDLKDRDIGTVFALLHDIGKIWLYTAERSPWARVGHEILGLQHVMAPLASLEKEWSDGAAALAVLLSGRWRQRDGKAVLAIAEVVRGLDQLSAERDLRSRPAGRFAPWEPTDWAAVRNTAGASRSGMPNAVAR